MTRVLNRRRREAKTDYRTRRSLLESRMPRLVVRKSNRFITAQIITSKQAQDSIVCGATSKELLSNGWPKDKIGSLKSLPACYLLGKLISSKAKSHKISELILDLGMNRNVKKSRIYAVLKGAVDGGLKIPHSEDVLPTIEQMSKNTKTSNLLTLKENVK